MEKQLNPHQTNRELWLAFVAILLITLAYLYVLLAFEKVPAASEFFGHSLGIMGFVMMLMTETLYSLRKRSRSAKWGRMAQWLEFHIFTGLVGPFMVLLHSSWKFNGLAGVVTLLTAIIVISGFVGRYIYTRLPRTISGADAEAEMIRIEITRLSTFLHHQSLKTIQKKFNDIRGPFRSLQARLIIARLPQQIRTSAWRLFNLIEQRRTLEKNLASLSAARRGMSIWYAVHIPIGMALFSAAFVHIVAAVYYATLLR